MPVDDPDIPDLVVDSAFAPRISSQPTPRTQKSSNATNIASYFSGLLYLLFGSALESPPNSSETLPDSPVQDPPPKLTDRDFVKTADKTRKRKKYWAASGQSSSSTDDEPLLPPGTETQVSYGDYILRWEHWQVKYRTFDTAELRLTIFL